MKRAVQFVIIFGKIYFFANTTIFVINNIIRLNNSLLELTCSRRVTLKIHNIFPSILYLR